MRRVPAGVLLIGAVLAFIGAGLVLGGAYFALARRGTGWMVWLTALALGPLVLYSALHLVRLSRWTWPAMLALLVLLLLSSLLRLVGGPGIAVGALVEVGAELLGLLYLTRPGVRRRFGWS